MEIQSVWGTLTGTGIGTKKNLAQSHVSLRWPSQCVYLRNTKIVHGLKRWNSVQFCKFTLPPPIKWYLEHVPDRRKEHDVRASKPHAPECKMSRAAGRVLWPPLQNPVSPRVSAGHVSISEIVQLFTKPASFWSGHKARVYFSVPLC